MSRAGVDLPEDSRPGAGSVAAPHLEAVQPIVRDEIEGAPDDRELSDPGLVSTRPDVPDEGGALGRAVGAPELPPAVIGAHEENPSVHPGRLSYREA